MNDIVSQIENQQESALKVKKQRNCTLKCKADGRNTAKSKGLFVHLSTGRAKPPKLEENLIGVRKRLGFQPKRLKTP